MISKFLRRLCLLIRGVRLRQYDWETPKFPNGYHSEINDVWLASQARH